MPTRSTSVMKEPADAYQRLQTLAADAGISLYQLARDAGVNQMTLYKQKHQKGGMWSTNTLNSVSTVLAERLRVPPTEVYAYLTGLSASTPKRRCA